MSRLSLRGHRLRHRDDIARLRRSGRAWRHPLLVLLLHRNELTYSRFGFVASRRIGKAVVRNRARRLLREAVRLNIHQIESGWDCLLIARAKTPTATFSEIESAVLELLNRSQIMRREG